MTTQLLDTAVVGYQTAAPVVRPKFDPKISIVVPARNEARNLEIILPALPKVHEVILVDGHSSDDTIEAARRVMPDIRVFQQTRRGKGNALAVGFQAVTGDIVVMFDADGSADPAEIPAFVEALLHGADFAKGTRFVSGGGSHDITPIRKAGNAGLNGTANVLFNTEFTDLCYGYNAFWADIIPSLDLPDPFEVVDPSVHFWGDGFEIETLLNCRVAAYGYTIREVPSVELLRIHGESNLNAVSDGVRVLRTMLSERRRATRLRRAARKAQNPSNTVITDATIISVVKSAEPAVGRRAV